MIKQQRGFTLVELSIVLVILGLLIGGVLTGQSLIRAAELRSVTTQYSRYSAAVNTFKDKYFSYPGDMTNATSYWGAADGSTGNTAGCSTTASTTALTCNGNGDGVIGNVTSSMEFFRFWQHLANAGLIEGNYDGINHSATAYAGAVPANSPTGRLNSSLWYIGSWGTLSGQGYAFDGVYGNSFEFGGMLANFDPASPILKPEDAYNIDLKTDDGKPATGRVVMRGSSNTVACTDSTSSANMAANYNLANTSLQCGLYFRNQF